MAGPDKIRIFSELWTALAEKNIDPRSLKVIVEDYDNHWVVSGSLTYHGETKYFDYKCMMEGIKEYEQVKWNTFAARRAADAFEAIFFPEKVEWIKEFEKRLDKLVAE